MELGTFVRLALLSTAIGVAAPALAQDKPAAGQPAPQAPAAQQPAGGDAKGPGPMSETPPPAPQPDWVKLCQTDPNAKKEVCMTSRDLRTDTGQTIASIAVRTVQGDNRRTVLAAVPPGLLLQPGIRVAVDQNTPVNGKFSICFPNACYAEVEINDAFFKNFQKGQNLVIQAMNQEAKTLNFPIGLGGFTKAFDGQSVDPKVAEEYKKEMNDAMNKEAQARRDKLQIQGPAAPTDGGPNIGGRAPVKAAQ